MFRLVVLSALLSGCSVTLGALGEGTLRKAETSTAAGVRVEWQAHAPGTSADGFAFGFRLDHLFQATPAAGYDRSRWEGLLGWGVVPRGYRRNFGVDLLARVGFARGALGGAAPTPAALSVGASFALPMRLNAPRFGDDEVLRLTYMIVPFLDAGLLWSPDLGPQFQVGGGLALRIHVDSALLP